MAAQTDLWGKLEPALPRTPVTILREQASLLAKKTNGLVEAEVVTSALGDGTFVHTFRLVVPALDHYVYELLKVRHGIDIYPVSASGLGQEGWSELVHEDAVIDWLSRVLSSNATKQRVSALMAQAST